MRFVELFAKLNPLTLPLLALESVRALYRSLWMRERWPSLEYQRYLDRPLEEIREEFNIRVV